MKAVLCKAYGPPESLVFEDVPSPVPGPGEVVLSVKAASVNFPDVLIIENKYQTQAAAARFRRAASWRASSSPSATASRACKPGDRVMAITGYGAFAEEVKTESRACWPIPAGHGLPDRRGVRPHLRDVGARAGRSRRAEGRRNAAGARRVRRRRPGGDRDRQDRSARA